MGLYINPTNCSKTKWLADHGIKLENPEYATGDLVSVCVVDNYRFLAAGVVCSQQDFEDFSDPCDRRPKEWWIVEKKLLKEVCDPQDLKFYLNFTE